MILTWGGLVDVGFCRLRWLVSCLREGEWEAGVEELEGAALGGGGEVELVDGGFVGDGGEAQGVAGEGGEVVEQPAEGVDGCAVGMGLPAGFVLGARRAAGRGDRVRTGRRVFVGEGERGEVAA